MTKDADDETLYEFNLYDAEGKFLQRFPCLPPFEEAPWIAVSGDRYFVLVDDMTYHEATKVHFLPALRPPGSVPESEAGS